MAHTTQQLLQYQRNGARIIGPSGNDVSYDAYTSGGNHLVWLGRDASGREVRYRAGQCQAVTPDTGESWVDNQLK